MARLAVVEREKRKIKTNKKYAAKYKELKKHITELQKDPAANYEVLVEIRRKFRKLPRNASPCRIRRRCRITGRARGVYRKVGLCRNKFREHAMRGEVPGLIKASW